jgi:hypothetical protein
MVTKLNALLLLAVAGPLDCVQAQATWIYKMPSAAPPAGSQYGMVFDEGRALTVLVGYGKTWSWDGAQWALLSSTVPVGTNTMCMAYDSLRGVVVCLASGGAYEWNGFGWTLRGPNPASYRRMAYDRSRDRMVVLGQGANPAFPAITYEWDGTTWQSFQQSPGPLDTDGPMTNMVFDSFRSRCQLWISVQGYPYPTGVYDGFWEWDGSTWVRGGFGPNHTYSIGARIAFDASSNSTVYYGGDYFPSTRWTDTYELHGASYVTLPTSRNPGSRYQHQLAYDSVRQAFVLFGGYYVSVNGNHYLRNETWELVRGGPLRAESDEYGVGCGLPPLTIGSAAGSRPLVGATHTSIIANTMSSPAAVACGFSNMRGSGTIPGDLPISLSWAGATGCSLWTSAESTGGVCLTTGVTAQFDLPLPNIPGLVGVQLYLQAYALRSGANPAQLVVSNGLQLTIGDQ